MPEKKDEQNEATKSATCGIVMPISALDGCSEQHWVDVQNILYDTIRQAGFEPNLVSNADDVGIIQKRIIQNLYTNTLVVCDVSGKNPNVMFELGIRLAFDKPTIIVKDYKTTYSFDTSPIEHLEYPRDLRFNKIVDFKKSLQEKLKATYDKANDDPNYSTFLKNFGKFTIAKLETEEIAKDQYILEEIAEMRGMMQHLISRVRPLERNLFDIYDRELPRPHHLSPDECERTLLEATRIIHAVLREQGISRRMLTNTVNIIEKAREMDLLPQCFRDENSACKEMIQRVIRKVNRELSINTDVDKSSR
ncbi:MAG: hypothetical protein ACM3YE_06160 [Bacteroidota bacterium]